MMSLHVKSTSQCVSFADEIPLKTRNNDRLRSVHADTISNNCGYSEVISNVPPDQNAVMFQYPNTEVVYHFRSYKRPSKLDQLQENWRKMGSDALATVLSALYGKLLVVLGMAFPMSEVISTHIPHSYYEVYYLYLYIGSMLFLSYMYIMLCKLNKKSSNKSSDDESSSSCMEMDNSSPTSTSHSSGGESDYKKEVRKMNDLYLRPTITEKKVNKFRTKYFSQNRQVSQHFGSFYLRMGAVAFGIGSMIYSGLEIGQYFELERNTKCHNVLVAVTPATRMAFIFIQMYFIFLNEDEQTKVTRHRIFSRFGLMHMIATNLAVWLNVLIQETKHEILTFYNPENNTIEMSKQNSHQLTFAKASTFVPTPSHVSNGSHQSHTRLTSSVLGANSTTVITSTVAPAAPLAPMTSSFLESVISNHTESIRHKRSLGGTHYIYDCRRTNIIGSLVQNASPFLFPCTIEYSLICAAILYVMWRNLSNVDSTNSSSGSTSKLPQIPQFKKGPHHYSVDCAQAHKGLFLGIFFLVLTIISLILFFVLVSKPELVAFAVMEVNVCELSLYGLSTAGSLIGMIQVRQLKFNGSRNLELDNILLVGAQTGILMYSTFTIIGCQFTEEKNTLLVSFTAFASLIQTTCQTLFILDASRRSCITQEQIRCKPGRETITFLLVDNLAMWAINTLEKSRADSHPIQLHFYGLWAWTIITHVSMPLAIFYRFHSTVCLCEIWKRAYKIKHSYV